LWQEILMAMGGEYAEVSKRTRTDGLWKYTDAVLTDTNGWKDIGGAKDRIWYLYHSMSYIKYGNHLK
jgi:hypothetical protein